MKFYAVLCTLLCASLGVRAAPVDDTTLAFVARGKLAPVTVTTPIYDAMLRIHPGLVPETTYAFTWTTPYVNDPNDPETSALRETLGFNHIFLMMGTVKSTFRPNPAKSKPDTTTLDFTNAWVFDMINPGAKNEQRMSTFSAPASSNIWSSMRFVRTTSKTYENMQRLGSAWIADHETYNYVVGGNNCDGYVKHMIENL